MSDRRDDRDSRRAYSPCYRLLVERPKIFARTAAASDDKCIDPRRELGAFVVLVRKLYGAGDFESSILALHTRRDQDHADRPCTPRQHVEDVEECSSRRRSHNTNSPWERGQRALDGIVEQTFGREF